MLADYGADVVWVEPPGGDPLRRRDVPAAVSVFNRGKRSVELDLADRAAREQPAHTGGSRRGVRRELATRRRGTPRTRLSGRCTHATRLLSTSRSRGSVKRTATPTCPAYEPIVQAVVGRWRIRSAHRDGPVFLGFPFASAGAASLAVIGALAALRRGRQDGYGRHVLYVTPRRRARVPLDAVGRDRCLRRGKCGPFPLPRQLRRACGC